MWGFIERCSGVAAKFNRKDWREEEFLYFLWCYGPCIWILFVFYERCNQGFGTEIIFGCWIWIGNYSKNQTPGFWFYQGYNKDSKYVKQI